MNIPMLRNTNCSNLHRAELLTQCGLLTQQCIELRKNLYGFGISITMYVWYRESKWLCLVSKQIPYSLQKDKVLSSITNVTVTDFPPDLLKIDKFRKYINKQSSKIFPIFFSTLFRPAPSVLVYLLYSNYLQRKLLSSFRYYKSGFDTANMD